jgi:hypothetical protein
LQTQKVWRAGNSRSGENEPGHGSQDVVEVAATSARTLGTDLEAKVCPNTQPDQLIRFNEQMQGSNIWNTAWRNRPLIQQHAFWEVRNGESALFWQDSWQQLPPLDDLESLNLSSLKLTAKYLQKVKDFWIPTQERQPGDNGKPAKQITDYGGY